MKKVLRCLFNMDVNTKFRFQMVFMIMVLTQVSIILTSFAIYKDHSLHMSSGAALDKTYYEAKMISAWAQGLIIGFTSLLLLCGKIYSSLICPWWEKFREYVNED